MSEFGPELEVCPEVITLGGEYQSPHIELNVESEFFFHEVKGDSYVTGSTF